MDELSAEQLEAEEVAFLATQRAVAVAKEVSEWSKKKNREAAHWEKFTS